MKDIHSNNTYRSCIDRQHRERQKYRKQTMNTAKNGRGGRKTQNKEGTEDMKKEIYRTKISK
jgi:hypothetical protein